MKLPGGASGRGPTCQARDTRDAGFIPESRRSPGEGHGKPLQYSRLENPMDRSLADYSTWGYKNRTWLKWLSMQMKLRFLMSHHRKDSVRNKVMGNKWIYSDSERSTLHIQSVGHCRRQVWPRNVMWLVFIGWIISYANEWDILERKVKWALGSITTYKAREGDGIPVEYFKH